MIGYRNHTIALVNTAGTWYVMVWDASGQNIMDAPWGKVRDGGYAMAKSYVNELLRIEAMERLARIPQATFYGSRVFKAF